MGLLRRSAKVRATLQEEEDDLVKTLTKEISKEFSGALKEEVSPEEKKSAKDPKEAKAKDREPNKDNKKNITVAQFQLGYKGVKQLALRTAQFLKLNATEVREGEFVRRDRLSGDIIFNFEDDAEKREKLPIIGYVSYFRLSSGFDSTLYMTKAEMEAHALR